MFTAYKTDCAHLYQSEKSETNKQMESVKNTKLCWNPDSHFVSSDIYDCDSGPNKWLPSPQKT